MSCLILVPDRSKLHKAAIHTYPRDRSNGREHELDVEELWRKSHPGFEQNKKEIVEYRARPRLEDAIPKKGHYALALTHASHEDLLAMAMDENFPLLPSALRLALNTKTLYGLRGLIENGSSKCVPYLRAPNGIPEVGFADVRKIIEDNDLIARVPVPKSKIIHIHTRTSSPVVVDIPRYKKAK